MHQVWNGEIDSGDWSRRCVTHHDLRPRREIAGYFVKLRGDAVRGSSRFAGTLGENEEQRDMREMHGRCPGPAQALSRWPRPSSNLRD